jgi:hypothetical protein
LNVMSLLILWSFQIPCSCIFPPGMEFTFFWYAEWSPGTDARHIWLQKRRMVVPFKWREMQRLHCIREYTEHGFNISTECISDYAEFFFYHTLGHCRNLHWTLSRRSKHSFRQIRPKSSL